jgi:hypothetical protein
MLRRRGTALVAAAGAFVALVSGAGAASHLTGRVGAPPDLRTHKGVVRYLASLGIQSKGFVIQRGQRNYAGPRCPGKGWTCTRSARVVQIATRPGAVNRYEYSATAPAAPSPPGCGAVQNGPSNTFKAIITTSTSQSCAITQHATGSGSNFAQISETIQLGSGASQTASQDAQVTQTSEMGSNSAQITQKITQSISESATDVSESQVSDQTYSINQNGRHELVEGRPEPVADGNSNERHKRLAVPAREPDRACRPVQPRAVHKPEHPDRESDRDCGTQLGCLSDADRADPLLHQPGR